MLILSQEHNNIKFEVLCIWSADKYFQQFSFVIVVAAAAGEDPQGMHPNQMAGNLEKRLTPWVPTTHPVHHDFWTSGAFMTFWVCQNFKRLNN